MNRNFKRTAVGLVMAGASTFAFAQSSCDSVLSAYSEAVSIGDSSWASSIVSNHPECFGGEGPTSTTSNIQISATSFTQATAISRAIAARVMPLSGGPIKSAQATSGLAAGGMPQAWNVWANVDQNDTEFSYTNLAATKTRGANDVLTTVIGADYALASNMVAGVSLAFDDGDGWGQIAAGAKNKTSTDGYLLAPYLGYQLSKELSVDVSAGVGSGDYAGAGGLKAKADRWFAAANLNYARWMGDWQITGKASYLHGEEDYGNTKVNGVAQANTGSTNKLDQIRLNAQAGLWMNGFMPYAGLGYTSNVHRSSTAGSDPLGRDSFVATLGVNFFSLSSKVTGGLFYEQELNRKHADNQVISANVNFRF